MPLKEKYFNGYSGTRLVQENFNLITSFIQDSRSRILSRIQDLLPIGKIAAHSAYEMFSWYKYLIVSLVFSHLGFWSGILFLIAPFPDLCLLVLFQWINTSH